MALTLSPEILRHAYEFLAVTQPFAKWNMPDSEDLVFRVVHDPLVRGWCQMGDKPTLAISSRCISHTISLIATMAHEMIHLHQGVTNMETKAQHNAAFNKLAKRVCAIHGWDEKLF